MVANGSASPGFQNEIAPELCPSAQPTSVPSAMNRTDVMPPSIFSSFALTVVVAFPVSQSNTIPDGAPGQNVLLFASLNPDAASRAPLASNASARTPPTSHRN